MEQLKKVIKGIDVMKRTAMNFMPDDTVALHKLLKDILSQYPADEIAQMFLDEISLQDALNFARDLLGISGDISDELLMEHIHADTIEKIL